ncbi:hypothetical protein BT69DRAFT_128780 [Atractiella rhizophila]|nr:hypothetical protein BT69DRAFT_128780 [Atractiella rhizophila]
MNFYRQKVLWNCGSWLTHIFRRPPSVRNTPRRSDPVYIYEAPNEDARRKLPQPTPSPSRPVAPLTQHATSTIASASSGKVFSIFAPCAPAISTGEMGSISLGPAQQLTPTTTSDGVTRSSHTEAMRGTGSNSMRRKREAVQPAADRLTKKHKKCGAQRSSNAVLPLDDNEGLNAAVAEGSDDNIPSFPSKRREKYYEWYKELCQFNGFSEAKGKMVPKIE